MGLDFNALAKIISPLLSLVAGAIAKYYFEGRPRLISFLGHASSFKLKDENQTTVNTHSIIVRNTGRRAARNVRLSHAILPDNITIFPPTQYVIERNPEGQSDILIPVLVPKEQVTISYLYFAPTLANQINLTTKSDEGFAKIINVIPMPQPRKAALVAVWLLMFIGFSFSLYWALRLIAVIV